MESIRYKRVKYKIDKYQRKSLHDLIIRCCGGRKGENFKKGVSLEELIDYKNKDNTDKYKLQLYVSAIDDIVKGINRIYPFLDMTGINLNWTTNKIIKYVTIACNNAPIITLKDIEKVINENGCK